MNQTPPTRWGIWSTGRMAEWFVTDFPHVRDGELAAVASRSRDRAEGFAARFEIPAAYGSFDELLDDPTVDVVYIATPHNLHATNARDALEAGKAVLCEKPLCVDAQEVRDLIAVSEATGGYLMEAMWTYFLPAIRTARRWVDEGRIGRVVHVKADFGYPQTYDPTRREYDASSAGGALLEMGIYPIAFAWLFVERDPATVRVTTRYAPNGVEDDVVALFDYPAESGRAACTATLGTSFRCKLPNWAYVVGTDGTIAIPDFWRARACLLYELDTLVESFDDARRHQGFSYEAEAVQADLRAGRRQSETVPLSISLRWQEHLAAIRRAG